MATVVRGSTSGTFHRTESIYIDPIVGELHGEAAITGWIAEVVADSAASAFVPLGPLVSNGSTSVQEWKRVLVGDPESTAVLRGTSVRRIAHGFTVYAADYYDTAALISSLR